MKKQGTIYLFFKRLFDISCSLIGMVGTLPLWLIAIIGIEISDPGPVFYMANRVGEDNKVFRMYKFRSMRQGKANESVFRGDEDRIFPFGHFIRDSKIDELPQLINIFIGNMSIVGPRPAAVDQMQITRGGKYAVVSNVQCGLTGPSALYDYIYGDSVEGADDYETLVLPTRLALDLVYLDKISFWFDIKMIWWTIECIILTILHKKPEMIFNTLVSWANEKELMEKQHG